MLKVCFIDKISLLYEKYNMHMQITIPDLSGSGENKDELKWFQKK